jgi:CheY-like chemotaxis protein
LAAPPAWPDHRIPPAWQCLSDKIHFADDDEQPDNEDTAPELAPLVLMIVDDDRNVHEATLLALAGEKVHGRALSFRHAYSAADAAAQLAESQDVTVMLLDVVMETPDAGLRLIPKIRALPGLDGMRIILRTGQPGSAPEADIRTRFAIDAYITKPRLTRSLLLGALGEVLATGGPPADPAPH